MKTLTTIILICAFVTTTYSQNHSESRLPMLGEKAPKFSAKSTNGNINFPDDYYGKWKILFSHPASFTPVCTTELLERLYAWEAREFRFVRHLTLTHNMGIN